MPEKPSAWNATDPKLEVELVRVTKPPFVAHTPIAVPIVYTDCACIKELEPFIRKPK
jgi:hypothetical protein